MSDPTSNFEFVTGEDRVLMSAAITVALAMREATGMPPEDAQRLLEIVDSLSNMPQAVTDGIAQALAPE